MTVDSIHATTRTSELVAAVLAFPVEEVDGTGGFPPPFSEIAREDAAGLGRLSIVHNSDTIWLNCHVPPEPRPGRYLRVDKRWLSGYLDAYLFAPRTMAEIKHAALLAALDRHAGNRTHAAQELGISVRTLQRNLKDSPCAAVVSPSASAGTCVDSGCCGGTCSSGSARTA